MLERLYSANGRLSYTQAGMEKKEIVENYRHRLFNDDI
nr:MAG TPA: hypothetical protein [Caudoviricetes sp.]